MRRFLVVPCLMLVLGIGSASASGPSPADAPNDGSAGGGPQSVLQTALFGLGEVNLSALGVSQTDLATVGPQLSLLSSNGDDMLIVDDDGLDCPNWEYPTIQSAVDAAQPGDKIKVCRGLYIEQVTIPAGKDGLTLFSEAALQAVIQAPPTIAVNTPRAIVRVNGAEDVTIRHFTITGPGPGPCGSIEYGVRVDGNGSALITDNHITKIRDMPLSGCQNGHAVNIGRVADGGVGTATVVHNLIDDYQKTGVLVSNNSRAEVAYNEITGAGPTGAIAQNGIQVSAGAEGDVHHNKISRNVYIPTGTESTGTLLISQPGPTRVHHNDVFLNEDGIGIASTVYPTLGTVEVSYNNSRNNVGDGIIVYDGSSQNLIAYNKAFENGSQDCVDNSTGSYNFPALVANRWFKDLGRTENRQGLCKQAGPQ